ncbi:MAG: metallophosphoesterase [Clostridium sp.]
MIGYAAIAAAAVMGFFARSEYEKKHFVTEQYTVYSEKFEQPVHNLVFLSDLHNYVFGEDNDKLIKAIDSIHPDGVLIGGDMVLCKNGRTLDIVLNLMANLTQRYPVYYGNGNHEVRMREYKGIGGSRYDDFVKKLSDMGVHYLSDASAELYDDIRITGYNVEEAYYRHRFTVPQLPLGNIKQHVGEADQKRFQILLMHSPLFFENAAAWGADLTLSGHFHGGTIRLPIFGGIMTPQYQFFLPWCAGRFDKAGKTMIVSRGLGTHSINIRFNNRPQLIWLQLKQGKEKKG